MKAFQSSLIFLAFLFTQCSPSSSIFLDQGNWEVNGEAGWQFDQSIIIGESSGPAGYLISNEKYSDFVMTAEFHPSAEVNSGIFIRCSDNEMSPMNCYEFNIYDNHPKQEYRTGAIVMKSPPSTTVSTIGKWNTYKIKAKGSSLSAWINGKKVVDISDNDRATGLIGLQASGEGKVMFRNVKVKGI